ncbi:MAG: AraC family transcriptional regulator [Kibdelosporangium sp.]
MEQATWTRVDAGQGAPLDMLTARFTRHVFAPHAHEEFSIGVCTDGLEVIDIRGTRHYAGPGSVVVIEPGATHTGGPAAPGGFAYRVLYPQWTSLAEPDIPYFREPVIDDPELAAEILRTHAALVRWHDPLEAESRLVWVLAKLVRRHAVGVASPKPASSDVVSATKDRLADRMVSPPALHEIAADLGLSRFQLLRVFRETVGMPPYAWLSQHRVNRARALLAEGHRPAQAAALTGFADQAHLTRWFRRVLGVTPGAFRNSVQDSRGPILRG